MWISVEYQIQTRTLTSNKELEKREIITQNIGKVLLIDDLGCGIEKFKQKVQKFNSSGNINLNDSTLRKTVRNFKAFMDLCRGLDKEFEHII